MLLCVHCPGCITCTPSRCSTVSCIIWLREEVNKVDLSVLDLGWAIIRKVRILGVSGKSRHHIKDVIYTFSQLRLQHWSTIYSTCCCCHFNHSQCDMMPESSEYLSLAVMTSLLLTCLPVVFRAHIYWTHVEQIHVQDLCLQNITQLLHVSPLILGSNWRWVIHPHSRFCVVVLWFIARHL